MLQMVLPEPLYNTIRRKMSFPFFSTVPILKLYNENTPKLSKTFWVERVQSKR